MGKVLPDPVQSVTIILSENQFQALCGSDLYKWSHPWVSPGPGIVVTAQSFPGPGGGHSSQNERETLAAPPSLPLTRLCQHSSQERGGEETSHSVKYPVGVENFCPSHLCDRPICLHLEGGASVHPQAQRQVHPGVPLRLQFRGHRGPEAQTLQGDKAACSCSEKKGKYAAGSLETAQSGTQKNGDSQPLESVHHEKAIHHHRLSPSLLLHNRQCQNTSSRRS